MWALSVAELLPPLRNVAVFVCRGLTPFDVLLVDEHLDALLDHTDTGVESGFGLIDDLHTNTPRLNNRGSQSWRPTGFSLKGRGCG